MKLPEAIKICEGWFDYLERQALRSIRMQQLASLARTNPEEARRQMAQMDNSLTVYDGARLEPAVRFLVQHAAKRGEKRSPSACR